MKTRAMLILSFCALTLPIFGDALKPEDEKAIAAAEKQWIDALMNKDMTALEKVLSDDLIWTNTANKHDTKDGIIKAAQSHEKYVSIANESTKRRQYGNVVVATYDQRMKYVPRTATQLGGTYNFVTMVWVKQGGRWQIVARQATQNPVPTKAP